MPPWPIKGRLEKRGQEKTIICSFRFASDSAAAAAAVVAAAKFVPEQHADVAEHRDAYTLGSKLWQPVQVQRCTAVPLEADTAWEVHIDPCIFWPYHSATGVTSVHKESGIAEPKSDLENFAGHGRHWLGQQPLAFVVAGGSFADLFGGFDFAGFASGAVAAAGPFGVGLVVHA